MQVVTEVPARLAAAALALLVALALVVASPTSASAEDPPDYVVDTSQDENGSPDDCIDPGELKQCSLREAVRAANQTPGRQVIGFTVDTVEVAGSPIIVTDSVEIRGGGVAIGPGSPSVRVSGGPHRLVVVRAAVSPPGGVTRGAVPAEREPLDVTMTGVHFHVPSSPGPTLRASGSCSAGPFSTGGLLVAGMPGVDTTVEIEGSSFDGGTALRGGNILVTNSWGSATRLTLDDTDVTDGCARFGGGNILVDGSRKGGATVLEVTNGSTVFGGRAELGGGIGAVQHARVSVADSVISGNTAGTVGGGLAFRDASDGVLDGARVIGNTSQVGGGIFHSTFTPYLHIGVRGVQRESLEETIDLALEPVAGLSHLRLVDSTVAGNTVTSPSRARTHAPDEDDVLAELFGVLCAAVVRGTVESGRTAGAGVATCGTALTVSGSQISGNQGAELGGGVAAFLTIPGGLGDGTVDLEATLTAVDDTLDAGMLTGLAESLSLFTDTRITGNQAIGELGSLGGGVLLVLSGGLTIRSEISGNAAELMPGPAGEPDDDDDSEDDGGPCSCVDFELTILGGVGGGVATLLSLFGAVNTTVAENTAEAGGAGIVSIASLLATAFTTIADNDLLLPVTESEGRAVPRVEAPGEGDGPLVGENLFAIGLEGELPLDGIVGEMAEMVDDETLDEEVSGIPVILLATLVADTSPSDTATSPGGPIPSCAYVGTSPLGFANLTDDASCGDGASDVSGFAVVADTRIAPTLAANQTQNGTFTRALLAGSPAIDAADLSLAGMDAGDRRTTLFADADPDLVLCGPGSALVTQDQRQRPRPLDGDSDGVAVCDVGAFEYRQSPPSSGPDDDPELPPGEEPEEPEVDRVGGPTRVETAVLVSQEQHEDGSVSDILLARFDDPADALTSIRLADELGAPLLLTQPDTLHPATAEEIQRVADPAGATVWLMGGVEALSPDVESAVADLDVATGRVGGSNRFETATLIADLLVGDTSLAQADGVPVLLADGGTFPAPTTAGVAAVAVEGVVLLTSGTTMPPETAAWLAAHPGAVPTAVGSAAGGALPSAVQVGGDDPVGLSVAVATEFFDDPAAAGLATREVFPDALVGAIAIAAEPGPMLLTAPDELPTLLVEYLQGPGASIRHLRVFGGTEAIADAVVDAAVLALTPEPTTP